MNDGDVRNLKPRSSLHVAGGSRWFQFSLTSLFVLVTVMALVLSTFFSVGRLVGMSNTDVLMQGLQPFLFVLPTLLVWVVGLTMAIRRRKRHRAAAIVSIIAFGGLVLTAIVAYALGMVLMYLLISGRTAGFNYWDFSLLQWDFSILRAASPLRFPTDWVLVLLQVICAVLYPIYWILVLVAIFAKRPSDAPQPERASASGCAVSFAGALVIIPSGCAVSFASVLVIVVAVMALAAGLDVGGLPGQFLSTLPTLLVWIVGLGIAIRRRRRNRAAAMLAMIALGGLVVTELVFHSVRMALLRLDTLGQLATWGFLLVGVLYAVLQPIWWSLILLAIFAGRLPDAPETEPIDAGGAPGG